MVFDPLSLDGRKINLVIDLMLDARREAQRTDPATKAHLSFARNALDEILRTKKYKFGIMLFKELEMRFTEVREDLANMRGLLEDKS